MKDEQILCAALLTGGAETAPRNLNTGEIALTDRGDDTCGILVPTLRVGMHVWDALRRNDRRAKLRSSTTRSVGASIPTRSVGTRIKAFAVFDLSLIHGIAPRHLRKRGTGIGCAPAFPWETC